MDVGIAAEIRLIEMGLTPLGRFAAEVTQRVEGTVIQCPLPEAGDNMVRLGVVFRPHERGR